MKNRYLTIFVISIFAVLSCRQYIDTEITTHQYFDKPKSDTEPEQILVAATDEEYLQYGTRVSYVNDKGEVMIPFGKYAYFGTDTLKHYANLIEYPNDSSYGRHIAIDRNQNILFDIVLFDNGPDYYSEGLVRVLRNGKMGYADEFGHIVIPCEYDFAKPFENGKAEVTYEARVYLDLDEHKRVESDEWLIIDKNGNRIK